MPGMVTQQFIAEPKLPLFYTIIEETARLGMLLFFYGIDVNTVTATPLLKTPMP